MGTRKIRELELTIDAVPGSVAVTLFDEGKILGEVTAYDVEPATLSPPCRRALGSLRRLSNLSLAPYVVFYSRLHERLRGTGAGTAMYLAAAEGAARLHGALVQHACFFDPDEGGRRGSTSRLAQQVWGGGRFRTKSRVYGGRVAFMPAGGWGSGKAMVRFGQLEVLVDDGRREPNPTPREFGRSLSQALEGDDAKKIIERHPGIQGTGWTSGSCMVLALALKRWFSPFRVAGVAWHGQVHHVLVECGGLYFDSDGASTRTELTHRWREHEPEARVIWLEAPNVKYTEIVPPPKGGRAAPAIPSPPAAVAELHEYVQGRFGSPISWGLAACGRRRRPNPLHRLSGADAFCSADGEVCFIDTDDGRPVDAVQVRQLVLEEGFNA